MNYSHERYARLIEEIFTKVKELSHLKGGEYSGDDDRLLNFRRNAAALGINKETIWAVYAAKHWDAVMQYVKDLETGKERTRSEPIEGRVYDLIVYMCLFAAMLDEAHRNTTAVDEWRQKQADHKDSGPFKFGEVHYVDDVSPLTAKAAAKSLIEDLAHERARQLKEMREEANRPFMGII